MSIEQFRIRNRSLTGFKMFAFLLQIGPRALCVLIDDKATSIQRRQPIRHFAIKREPLDPEWVKLATKALKGKDPSTLTWKTAEVSEFLCPIVFV